jgi:outer membrane protein TolC
MKSITVILSFLLFSITVFAQKKQLDYYISNAVANSPVLKDYKNQVRSGVYDSLLIKAAYKPQFAGNGSASYAPVVKGWGYDAAITNGQNLNALLGVTQQLPNKKTLKSQFENLQLQNQSLDNISKITEQDLKRNIIAQYITAFADLQQLSFNKDISALLSKEEFILKKLTQGNVYKQVDYLAFLVTLQQQNLLIKQISIQYKNDVALLNYLSGINDTSSVELQDPGISLRPLPDVGNSVFFKQFEIDSLKLKNSRELIDIAYRPKFNMFADAGYNSSFNTTPYKNLGTSFGVSATIPLYKGKQRKLEYSKIDISEDTRLNNKKFFTVQYNQQVAQLYQQLYATEELINDINKQLKYTQSLIDVNKQLLETGDVKITDFILALNNYINAKNLIAQNTISRLQIINQLNYWNR